MPGRLMVGRMTLDHVVEGSNPSPAAIPVCVWRYRLGARTGGSQPSNQGSIPCSATINLFDLTGLPFLFPEHSRASRAIRVLFDIRIID